LAKINSAFDGEKLMHKGGLIKINSRRWRLTTAAVIVLHFGLLLMLGLSRHWGYMTSLNDLGAFDQAVWGTLHGQFLPNTSILNQPINWLGFHFHPVLLLFAPLYAIAPYPEWFALAQALALSIAAWPIFLLASRVCRSEKAGLLWVLAYLANPFLLNAAAWDFHPVALAVPFIALGMLAVEKADSRLLFLSCLPLLFIQEQLGLTVAGFGALWWLRNKGWKTAVSLITLGTAHAALVLGVIMPAFSPTGQHLMLGSGLGQLNRYGWLGHSVGDVILALLIHPMATIEAAMVDMGGGVYFGLLLIPFVGFPVVAGVFLLPGFGDLAANTLSATPMPKSIFSYHSVSLVPILTTAAIYGVARISRWQKRFSVMELTGIALMASIIMGIGFAPLPLPGARNFWAPKHFMNQPDPALPAVRIAAGDSSLVSAQGNIGAHFSQRKGIYFYPNKVNEVDAIILRLDSPTTKVHLQDPGKGAGLAWHLQMRPAEYLASIECFLSGKEYGVALWRDPWLVFSRNAMKSGILQSEVELKLSRLRQEWEISADEYAAASKKCNK
jgi:uncharacterized membrane protein